MIHRTWKQAVARLRDPYGRIVDPAAESAAANERNRRAAELYLTLAPHTDTLVSQARTGLDGMAPARHHGAWRLLLDDLALAAGQAQQILAATQADAPGTALVARDAALWPYAVTWAEHALVAIHLAGPGEAATPLPVLSAAEAEELAGIVRAARADQTLVVTETWYDAAGSQISLAYAEDTDGYLAFAGDVDSPEVTPLGHFDDHDAAWQVLPRPVPAGVLRPDARPWDTPLTAGSIPLEELRDDVESAQHTAEVAETLDHLTNPHHPHVGHLVQLTELITSCAEFAAALDTRAGRDQAAQLRAGASQLGLLTSQLRMIHRDMSGSAGILPPYRVAHPRHLPPLPPPPQPTARRAGLPTAPVRTTAPASHPR